MVILRRNAACISLVSALSSLFIASNSWGQGVEQESVFRFADNTSEYHFSFADDVGQIQFKDRHGLRSIASGPLNLIPIASGDVSKSDRALQTIVADPAVPAALAGVGNRSVILFSSGENCALPVKPQDVSKFQVQRRQFSSGKHFTVQLNLKDGTQRGFLIDGESYRFVEIPSQYFNFKFTRTGDSIFLNNGLEKLAFKRNSFVHLDLPSGSFENGDPQLNPVLSLKDSIAKVMAKAEGRGDLEALTEFQSLVSRDLTGDIIDERTEENYYPIFGRRDEADSVLDTLVRVKGKNPVLLGEAGVGKTAIMQLVAELILDRQLPKSGEFQKVLQNALVVEITPFRISPKGNAGEVESFLKLLKLSEKLLGRKIVVFVDELHSFAGGALEALKTALDSKDGPLLVGATTFNEFGMLLQRNPALKRRFQGIDVKEFTVDQTIQLINQSWIKLLKLRYGGSNSQAEVDVAAIRSAVLRSREIYPDIAYPEGPFKLLMDVMIREHRAAGVDAPKVTIQSVADYIKSKTRAAIDPTNPREFLGQLAALKSKLHERVVDQARVTDAMVDLWRGIHLGTTAKETKKVLLIAGPTGAGKTHSALIFAELALGDARRLLEIDCTKFREPHALSALIGAPPGYISSNKTRGLLPEFLEGSGRGMNVIVLNELEKADPELARTLMEMMDTGKLQGADGKTYYLGKSLIVITSNKGDEAIYPRGQQEPLTREEMNARLSRIDDAFIRRAFTSGAGEVLHASILQRIDLAVPAGPPSFEGAVTIATQEIERKSQAVRERRGFEIVFDNAVITALVRANYRPEDGVREVIRKVQNIGNQAETAAIGLLSASPGKNVFVHIVAGGEAHPDQIFADLNNEKPSVHLGFLERPSRFDARAFTTEMEKIKLSLRTKVVDQNRFTDAMVDLWRDIHFGQGPKGRKKVLLVAGPTGAGKTFGAQTFALEVLGDRNRLFEIDCTRFKDDASLNSLIGAPPGYVSSERSRGQLIEFLEGAGRGKNVLVFNEFEKASRGFAETMMELMDTGMIQGRDGKTYYLGDSLIIITTNKGEDMIFPRGRKGGLSREEINERLEHFTDADIREAFLEPDPRDLLDKSNTLSPAIVARIDRAVAAPPPSREGAVEIVRQIFASKEKEFSDSAYRLSISVPQILASVIVENIYVPENGVRDLKRAVESLMNKAFSEALKDNAAVGATYHVVIEKNDGKNEVLAILGNETNSRNVIGQISANGKSILYDSQSAQSLLGLSDRLKKQIFGQDEIVDSVAQAIVNHKLLSNQARPVRLLFLGTTGTGKTELAKAIGHEVYGSSERVSAYDLGKIKDEHDLWNIFGSPRGLIGSNTLPPFESFLNAFPEGGVILFDELGNMNPKLLKVFYAMLDEGIWTSPQGKSYSLKNFTVIFTSNEGEEIFRNLPSDELRLQVWRNSHSRAQLHALLSFHKWPEALIGRIGGNFYLFKPLDIPAREKIANKFLSRLITESQSRYEFLKTEIDPTMDTILATRFFTHAEGGRQIESVVSSTIAAALTDAVLEVHRKGGHALFKSTQLFLSIIEAKLDRPMSVEANLKYADGTIHTVSRSLSSGLADVRNVSDEDRLRTATHEAGHVVANDPLLTGQELDHVLLNSDGNPYASYNQLQKRYVLTRPIAVALIAHLLGGQEAEKAAGLSFSSGWSDDWNRAKELAVSAIVEHGLTSNALTLPLNREAQVEIRAPKTQEEIHLLLSEGQVLARNLIEKNKQLLTDTTKLLQIYGRISRDDFVKLRDRTVNSCESVLNDP